MKETHFILRAPIPSTRDPFLGARALTSFDPPAAASLRVEVEDIERSEIANLTRNRDVVAVAPAMPVKLIQPRDEKDAAAPAAQEITWGVRAVGADTSPFSGNGVIVAVLDTGIDAAHSAFAGLEIIQKDFTGEGDGDKHGHGTHCAGTIFGRATDNTRIGVAPGVKRALIGKVLGTEGGSSDRIASAVNWSVENGANVISMSLGIDFPGYEARLQQQGLPPELATSRA